MKKIIIGHTGYIGSMLLHEFNKKNFNILGISRNKNIYNSGNNNPNFAEINTNIFKEIICDKLAIENRPTIYICAHNHQSNFFIKRKSLEFTYMNNISFYKNFFKNIKLLNPKKLIFLSSSGSLYDNSSQTFPSNEYSNLNPVSEYGLSKFIFENLLIDFSKKNELQLVICRVSTIYGNSNSIKKFGFINYLINCALNEITPVIYGKDTYRDYLHIKDLIEVLIEISNKDLLSNIYNISYGKSYSCMQIYNKVKIYLNKLGYQIKNFEEKGIRLGENSKIFISSDKLKNELIWSPSININEGINTLKIN